MSNFAPFSKKSTSFSVSVDLVSSIACASSFSAMYSIQAWFSGTLPCLSWKSATKALEAGVSRLWCHTVGQVPLRLPSPAAQASAVGRGKPTGGQGRTNTAYWFTKWRSEENTSEIQTQRRKSDAGDREKKKKETIRGANNM